MLCFGTHTSNSRYVPLVGCFIFDCFLVLICVCINHQCNSRFIFLIEKLFKICSALKISLMHCTNNSWCTCEACCLSYQSWPIFVCFMEIIKDTHNSPSKGTDHLSNFIFGLQLLNTKWSIIANQIRIYWFVLITLDVWRHVRRNKEETRRMKEKRGIFVCLFIYIKMESEVVTNMMYLLRELRELRARQLAAH